MGGGVGTLLAAVVATAQLGAVGGDHDGADRDVAVVGGGLVGSSIAYGLRERVASIAVLDEGDVALRASRGEVTVG